MEVAQRTVSVCRVKEPAVVVVVVNALLAMGKDGHGTFHAVAQEL